MINLSNPFARLLPALVLPAMLVVGCASDSQPATSGEAETQMSETSPSVEPKTDYFMAARNGKQYVVNSTEEAAKTYTGEAGTEFVTYTDGSGNEIMISKENEQALVAGYEKNEKTQLTKK